MNEFRKPLGQPLFDYVSNRLLVYNVCWEDPALDRQALRITPEDTLLAISSAGCNVLDYALCGPKKIFAVDANPCQVALLELRMSAIRNLDYEDFFRVFGDGVHPEFAALYRRRLRADLSLFARSFWDERSDWFSGKGVRDSFYLYALSGAFALFYRYFMRSRGVQPAFERLLATDSIEEQREIYFKEIDPVLWTPSVRWIMSQQLFMTLMAVPKNQSDAITRYPDGVAGYIRASVAQVMMQLPLKTNYFWQVYMRGSYPRWCCPEYLKEEGFHALKGGLLNRISVHNATITDFLRQQDVSISKYILLDHMDWVGANGAQILSEEWSQIVRRGQGKCRAIFRSVHEKPAFLASVGVAQSSSTAPLLNLLQFDYKLGEQLHSLDRVGTYRAFYITDFHGEA